MASARPQRRAAPRTLKEASDSDEETVTLVQQEDDSDDIVINEQAPHKKRAAKQVPKTQSLEAVLSGAAGDAPARKRKAPVPAHLDAGQLSLLEQLVEYPHAAAAAAKAWVEKYRENPVPGTADLLSLLVQVAGACVEVTEQDVEEGDTDSLAVRLAESVINDGGCDPLHDRKTTQKLPGAFTMFCTTLMSEMDAAELLAGQADDFAMDKLLHTVMSLSSSNIRPFRLAATLCASCLVEGLVAARKKRAESLATAQFQYESENKKGKAANQSLVKSLKQAVDMYQRQSEALSAHISELIKTVFAVRFRDKQAEVRARVIYAIGHWVDMDPASFLADTHLKYLGWALSDKEPIVRYNAVNAVLRLYKDSDNVQGLRDFRSRFVDRMRELPYDLDERVAVKGMELLARLVSLKEIDPSQLQDTAALLADDIPEIRGAAAEVIVGVLAAQVQAHIQKLQSEGAEEATRPSSGAGGRSKAGTKAKGAAASAPVDIAAATKHAEMSVLLDLMQWLQPVGAEGISVLSSAAAPSPSHAPLEDQVVGLLTDALYDKWPIMKDVGHLASLLGSSDAVEGNVGGAAGAAHLASVLYHVVQRSHADTEHKPGAGKGPRGRGRKAASAHEVTQQELTQALMTHMPKLIRQYQTEPAVLTPLLRVVGHLELEVFALQGEERALGALLALVAEQVLRHSETSVLQAAAECLVTVATHGPGSIRAAAQLALDNTVSKVASGLVASVKAVSALSSTQLASEVEELSNAAAGTDVHDGAEVLWRLKASLLRCSALLTNGASQLSANKGARTALATLLKETASGQPEPKAQGRRGASQRSRDSGEGSARSLGPELLGLCLVMSQAALSCDLLQMGALPDDAAGGKAVDDTTTKDADTADKDAEAAEPAEPTEQDKGKTKGKGAAQKRKPRKGRGGRKGASQGDEEAEGSGDEEEGEGAGRVTRGSTQGQVPTAASLQQSVDEYSATLTALCEQYQDDSGYQELLMRAVSDLLFTFGVSTWKGTPAEDVCVSPDQAESLLHRCWSLCEDILNTATEEEQTLNSPDEEEDIDAQVAETKAAARVAVAARRLLALGAVIKLMLAPAALSQDDRDWLAARMLAQIAFHGPEVEQLIKDMVTELRRQDQQPVDTGTIKAPRLSYWLLGALDQAFESVKREHEAQEIAQTQALEDGDALAVVHTSALEEALDRLQRLATNIASLYRLAGVRQDEILGLMRLGTAWVLDSDEPRTRMYMMAWALTHFIVKLTPEDARQLRSELDPLLERAQDTAPRYEAMDTETQSEAQDPNWAQVDHFLSLLEDRAAKGGKGGAGKGGRQGALKGSRAAAAAARGDADAQAEGDGGEEDADDEIVVKEKGTGKGSRKRARVTAHDTHDNDEPMSDGEGEEARQPAAKRRARFAGGEAAQDKGAKAGAKGRKKGPPAATQQQAAGWHTLDRTSPGKRRVYERTTTVPLVAPAASDDERHSEEEYAEAHEQHSDDDQHDADNTNNLFGTSQPMSEDQQLPRAPTAASPQRRRTAALVANTLSQGTRTRGHGGADSQGLAASPSEVYEEEQGDEEADVGTGGGHVSEDEDEYQSAEGSEGEGEGGSMMASPSEGGPVESTQVSEPPPRAVRRRRL